MKTFPNPLTPDEEKYYFQKYTEGDLEAKHILIERNLRLVAHIVRKYQNLGEEMEDLIANGVLLPGEIPQQGLQSHWKVFTKFSDENYLMCRTEDGIVQYAPLCIHTFRLIAPRKLLEAQQFNQQYHSYEEIQNVPDRLRWCRHHMGLMQKEVAEQIGISRGHYIDYEVGYVDYYPKEVVDRLADFYHIPVEDLLDEYNLFLYKGQGKMLKECSREKMGLKKKPFARMLHVDPNTYRNWESDKKRMFKLTWEKYFREVLLANQNASNQNNI